MQIHEITLKPVAEGVLKNIANSLGRRVIQKAASATRISADAIMANAPKDTPAAGPAATPPEPEADISQTLDNTTQYKFLNPDYPGTSIIIRKSGYYIDRLPKVLVGQVKKDPKTGLYPVLRPDTIKKYNAYYDQAADRGQVKQEPIHAL